MGIFVKPSSEQKQPPPPRQPPQNYEPGLEVVHPLPWSRNDIALPELAPYHHVDAKTSSMPQVIDDPAWHRKKEQGLFLGAANSPAPSSYVVSPITYGSTAGLASPYQQQYPEVYHHQPPPPPPGPESRRICGMRRRVCYIVMAVAIVVAVAAIAIGVGVGLAFGQRQPRSSPSGSGFVYPSAVRQNILTCPAATPRMVWNPQGPRTSPARRRTTRPSRRRRRRRGTSASSAGTTTTARTAPSTSAPRTRRPWPAASTCAPRGGSASAPAGATTTATTCAG